MLVPVKVVCDIVLPVKTVLEPVTIVPVKLVPTLLVTDVVLTDVTLGVLRELVVSEVVTGLVGVVRIVVLAVGNAVLVWVLVLVDCCVCELDDGGWSPQRLHIHSMRPKTVGLGKSPPLPSSVIPPKDA